MGQTPPIKRDETRERDRQLLRTLLLVTFSFLILSLPLPIRNILFSYWNWKDDVISYVVATGVYHLSHLMYFTNGAGTSK